MLFGVVCARSVLASGFLIVAVLRAPAIKPWQETRRQGQQTPTVVQAPGEVGRTKW